jgi:hypothetical protein
VLNNTSKILITSGIITITIIKWWLGYEWLDVIGFSLLLVGFIYSKKEITESHQDYGMYIYYAIMALVMMFIFSKWFLL